MVSKTPMRKWILMPLVVGACARVAIDPTDLGAGAPADLSSRRTLDLSRQSPLDFAIAEDFAASDDLSTPPDDLAQPPAQPDLAHPQGACVVAINEIQTAGNGGNNDEFVELFNSCGSAVDLTGYKLLYRSAAGVSEETMVTFGKISLASGGFFVCGQKAYLGMADVTYSASMASPGGGVGLRNAAGVLVDSVGWGTATNAFVEVAVAVAPAVAKSISRLPDGHDTDDNAKDFTETTPTPKGPNK